MDKIDRLPVLIVGINIDVLLGVPKLSSGTAEKQLDAIFKLLEKNKVCENIVGMCFDTTATNTGIKGGTCLLLEKKLGRKLLHLACRHHIAELFLRAAYEEFMGTTTGPDVGIFKVFRSAWNDIDKNNYKSGISDSIVAKKLKSKDIKELTAFADNILKVSSHSIQVYFEKIFEILLISYVFFFRANVNHVEITKRC